jgi:hypothetical protein
VKNSCVDPLVSAVVGDVKRSAIIRKVTQHDSQVKGPDNGNRARPPKFGSVLRLGVGADSIASKGMIKVKEGKEGVEEEWQSICPLSLISHE